MYTLNLVFKQKTKKLTLPKSLASEGFYSLIAEPFNLKEKVIALTNPQGQLVTFDQIRKNPSAFQRQRLYLVATQDVNDDNMSFGILALLQAASDHGAQHQNDFLKKNQVFEAETYQSTQIPQKLQGFYQGVIGDLELFQELFLQESKLTIVFCFVKEKPKNFQYPYYLYHTSKNSAIIYFGSQRICQFFIESMNEIPKSIDAFVKSFFSQPTCSQNQIQQAAFNKKQKLKAPSKLSSKQSQERFSLNNHNHNHKAKEYDEELVFDSDDKFAQINENQDELGSDDEPLQIDNDEEDENNEKQQNQDSDEDDEGNQTEAEMQASLLENLLKLRNEDEITELEFYKMKSELLENLSDFMRKYQMGTRKCLRKDINRFQAEVEKKPKRPQHSNQPKRQVNQQRKNPEKQSKYEREELIATKQAQRNTRTPQSKRGARSPLSRDQRRIKKYQIPIIVRKYNNVIEKISTSYPLTQEQEQSINLILQLQLKGLISEKQAGIYKTSILQQDKEVVALFLDYFDNMIDQLQLASHLKKLKKINSQKKERSQHNMRLLIKYAKQGSYELLRRLLLDKNHLVLVALEKFRGDKNAERLALRLEKIAVVYRQKGELEEDVFD